MNYQVEGRGILRVMSARQIRQRPCNGRSAYLLVTCMAGERGRERGMKREREEGREGNEEEERGRERREVGE